MPDDWDVSPVLRHLHVERVRPERVAGWDIPIAILKGAVLASALMWWAEKLAGWLA